MNRLFLLLLAALLAACSGPVPVSAPASASAIPDLPTKIVTAMVTDTPAALPTTPPTATLTTPPVDTPSAVPSETSAPTAPPLPAETPSPTPTCDATFLPIGFSAEGSRLVGLMSVSGVDSTTLQVLYLKSMTMDSLMTIDGNVSVAALSSDGETVALALPGFTIRLIHLPNGKFTGDLTGHTAMVNALVFSPDGNRLYSASSDQSVIVWNMTRMECETTFQPTFTADNLPGAVLGLGISPDGKTLITIPIDGSTRAWNTDTFKPAGEYRGAISGGYNGSRAAYAQDGKFLAIGLAGGPGDTGLWQLPDNRPVWGGGMMAVFAFSPDSSRFAYTELDADNRSQVVIRSEDGQTVLRTIPATSDRMIVRLLFSPDSQTLVAAEGNMLHFWNVEDGSLKKTYTAPCP